MEACVYALIWGVFNIILGAGLSFLPDGGHVSSRWTTWCIKERERLTLLCLIQQPPNVGIRLKKQSRHLITRRATKVVMELVTSTGFTCSRVRKRIWMMSLVSLPLWNTQASVKSLNTTGIPQPAPPVDILIARNSTSACPSAASLLPWQATWNWAKNQSWKCPFQCQAHLELCCGLDFASHQAPVQLWWTSYESLCFVMDDNVRLSWQMHSAFVDLHKQLIIWRKSCLSYHTKSVCVQQQLTSADTNQNVLTLPRNLPNTAVACNSFVHKSSSWDSRDKIFGFSCFESSSSSQ